MASDMAKLWEVIGAGGVLVRDGPHVSCTIEHERLSAGALLQELQLDGERLRYRRLAGSGPHTGWVSLRVRSKVQVRAVPLRWTPDGPVLEPRQLLLPELARQLPEDLLGAASFSLLRRPRTSTCGGITFPGERQREAITRARPPQRPQAAVAAADSWPGERASCSRQVGDPVDKIMLAMQHEREALLKRRWQAQEAETLRQEEVAAELRMVRVIEEQRREEEAAAEHLLLEEEWIRAEEEQRRVLEEVAQRWRITEEELSAEEEQHREEEAARLGVRSSEEEAAAAERWMLEEALRATEKQQQASNAQHLAEERLSEEHKEELAAKQRRVEAEAAKLHSTEEALCQGRLTCRDSTSGVVQPFLPLSQEYFDSLPKPLPRRRMPPKKLQQASKITLPGEFHGIMFPYSPEQIEEWGPRWLTKAMQRAKTLPRDVVVQRFTSFRVLASNVMKAADNADDANWGGAGIKVLLSVEYSRAVPGVTSDLFIKLPHKMDGQSERYKISVLLNNDFPEVMFNVVLGNKIPFLSPRCYFADMNRESTNYIIILERLSCMNKAGGSHCPFELLPAPGKFLDFKLEKSGADHYYAQARAFARMAAWYQESTRLSPQLDYLFMPEEDAHRRQQERAESAGHWGPLETRLQQLRKLVGGIGQEALLAKAAPYATLDGSTARCILDLALDYLRNARALFPKGSLLEPWRKRLEADVGEFAAHSGLCNWVISKVFWELDVLAHINLQVDNGFYWRDEGGKMHAGLLDFGGVTHQPMPVVLMSGWVAAEAEVMDEHEDKLCSFFVDEVLAAGGQCCTAETFTMLLKLARGTHFLSTFLNCARLYQLIPHQELSTLKGRHDPRIEEAFLARCYGVGPMLAACGWRHRNPTAYLRKLKEFIGLH